jgi:hypothetical protein
VKRAGAARRKATKSRSAAKRRTARR